MSTPIFNSVPVTFGLSLAGLGNVASLIGGEKWGAGYGSGVVLTYSFPVVPGSFFIVPYGEGEQSSMLSSTERAGVRSALAALSALANGSCSAAADNSGLVGELRLAGRSLSGSAWLAWGTRRA